MQALLRTRHARTDGPEGSDERGFTIIELTVAMGLSAFVFAAVAAVMLGGLRSLAVSKARTQGNEVATQAIEDLQRFGYPELGLCAEPATTPPSGLTETVVLSGGCGSATLEDSCTSPSGTAIDDSYTCARNNITYNIRRYIAWADDGHTSKRLAVFVDWTDHVGNHTVSQQSSVRAPGVANVIGLSAPVLSSPSVSPSTVIISAGKVQSTVTMSISATGLTATDQVWAKFSTLDAYGQPQPDSLFLTPNATGTLWTGSIATTSDYTLGTGSQFVVFTAARAGDGKQTSIVTANVNKFCSPSDSSCSQSALPSFVGQPTVPNSVAIQPSGALNNDVTVSVTTRNITTDDDVYVSFLTQSGLVALPMSVSSPSTCTVSSCTWSVVIASNAGYAFSSGSRPMYFTSSQVVNPDPTSVDKGSTGAIASSNVTFG
jgi:type II secretory pathway pseudopilin PulG